MDTDRLEMQLPVDKLKELKSLIAAWLQRHAGKKEILSLIGNLAHAGKIIIIPVRTFLRCMIETTMKVKKLDH